MIEKEWCTYGWISSIEPERIGKVIADGKGSISILYSEGQMYPAECWDINYIKRFDTLEEAFEYLMKNKPSYDYRIDHPWSREKYWEHVQYCFPSYFKNKDSNVKKQSNTSHNSK